jgi:hypothetical protein
MRSSLQFPESTQQAVQAVQAVHSRWFGQHTTGWAGNTHETGMYSQDSVLWGVTARPNATCALLSSSPKRTQCTDAQRWCSQ